MSSLDRAKLFSPNVRQNCVRMIILCSSAIIPTNRHALAFFFSFCRREQQWNSGYPDERECLNWVGGYPLLGQKLLLKVGSTWCCFNLILPLMSMKTTNVGNTYLDTIFINPTWSCKELVVIWSSENIFSKNVSHRGAYLAMCCKLLNVDKAGKSTNPNRTDHLFWAGPFKKMWLFFFFFWVQGRSLHSNFRWGSAQKQTNIHFVVLHAIAFSLTPVILRNVEVMRQR